MGKKPTLEPLYAFQSISAWPYSILSAVFKLLYLHENQRGYAAFLMLC